MVKQIAAGHTGRMSNYLRWHVRSGWEYVVTNYLVNRTQCMYIHVHNGSST